MRQDEHKRALVDKGKELLKFNQVTDDQREILFDAELYIEGVIDDIRSISKALSSVHASMMAYWDQHKA